MISPKDAVKAAIALASPIDPAAQQRAESDEKRLAAEIAAVGKTIDGLLGIEVDAKPALVAKKRELVTKHEHAALMAKAPKSGYPLLSLEPFSWRDKDGWPRLVFFGLDSPDFAMGFRKSLEYRRDDWGGESAYTVARPIISPELPKALSACYSDVIARLRKRCARNHSIRLRARYAGVIPTEAKKKIEKARKVFKKVFIVAEPKGFSLETKKIAVPLPVDPLIVGWDGNFLWLVGSFDTTPVEEYVKQEFTT